MVTSTGTISGEQAMMQEIYANGPISCTIDASNPRLQHYNGSGVYSLSFWGTDTSTGESLDHEISVYGWGELEGTPYWLVRNSWGTFWGNGGSFRVLRGASNPADNLGIEEECYWGDPIFQVVDNPSDVIRSTWDSTFKHKKTKPPH